MELSVVLNILGGKVIGRDENPQWNREFVASFNQIDRLVSVDTVSADEHLQKSVWIDSHTSKFI